MLWWQIFVLIFSTAIIRSSCDKSSVNIRHVDQQGYCAKVIGDNDDSLCVDQVCRKRIVLPSIVRNYSMEENGGRTSSMCFCLLYTSPRVYVTGIQMCLSRYFILFFRFAV